MTNVAEDIESYLATAAVMLTAEGMNDAAALLRASTTRLEETGYDSWNGGTAIWTIYLLVNPVAYAKLGSSRESLEEQINNLPEAGFGAIYK